MNEWIEWDGKESGPPDIDGLRCDVRFRSGEEMDYVNSQDYWYDWCWEVREYDARDIVSYRIPEE